MSIFSHKSLKVKNYSSLLGIEGLSDQLLKNHFTLYEGYIKNAAKLEDEIVSLSKTKQYENSSYAELKRRAGWEFNGIKLHEYYFENLTKKSRPLDKNSSLYKRLKKDFGSFEKMLEIFRATGMMRGIGWVILYYDERFDRFFNMWINEHDTGHLSGATPLLVMDVFEHAYMLDYGTKKADYIEIFFNNIDWRVVSNRFDAAG